MSYEDFLDNIIKDGIAAAQKDYANKPDKLNGSIEGFEACRGKTPEELFKLLDSARLARQEARDRDDYWTVRCYELEVEWVCNCVAALQQTMKQKTIVTPTMRGYLKMSETVNRLREQG